MAQFTERSNKLPATKLGFQFLYVGSFTFPHFAPGAPSQSTAKGIAIFKLFDDGSLIPCTTVPAENPSFLATDPKYKSLYVVNELGENDEGKPLGTISAYRIDQESGSLTFLNAKKTQGTWPCHCSVTRNGDYLLAANYGSGNFCVFPLFSDGSIGDMSDFILSNGNGPDRARQEGPHGHMICESTDANKIICVDLGSDKLLVRDLNPETGKLTASAFPAIQVASGCGPRHIVFHRTIGNMYVVNELSSSVDVFTPIDPTESDKAVCIQSISTLPEDSDLNRPSFNAENPGYIPLGSNTASEICIHESGKWLYVSNRGMNTVVTYAIDPLRGTLTPLEWTSTEGECPRGMNLTPSGHFLCVGNQNSDTITIFAVDAEDGTLSAPVYNQPCATPVDFVFGPRGIDF